MKICVNLAILLTGHGTKNFQLQVLQPSSGLMRVKAPEAESFSLHFSFKAVNNFNLFLKIGTKITLIFCTQF